MKTKQIIECQILNGAIGYIIWIMELGKIEEKNSNPYVFVYDFKLID